MTQTDLQPQSDAPVARRRTDLLNSPYQLGRWELVELAAEGGLARVYRARPADSLSHRPAAYALKMLRPDWEDDPRAKAMV